LESFLTSLDTLLTSAVELWALEPATKATTLATKQAAQKELAEALIPENRTLDELLALLKTASPMCEMGDAAEHSCPLCKRELGASEVELFKQYNSLLVGGLEKDIVSIKAEIDKATELATSVEQVDRTEWDKCKTIQEDTLVTAKTGADLIVANCDITKEPLPEAKAEVESLKKAAIIWATQLEAKKTAIEVAEKGETAVTDQLAKLCLELEPLEYAHAIAEGSEKLKSTHAKALNAAFWDANLPSFTQVLRKITTKTKTAHEELVVVDFEAKLDAEYVALTEKSMSSFGVVLARIGADATVTVSPRIGGKDIKGVLSEGEQRVHALALFFAELETCSQSVVVFDDPVSSFDYNYIANYSTRLRDFTMTFPNKQIIVLTHNWEFFVQLQTTLNGAGLNRHLSVQVLENCAVVADYSEKVDDLKTDIAAILAATGEPIKALKEEMAGKMRRLIESVVNTHVFNNQRHQYKQKNQPVSVFHQFTQIVPLLQTEATTLRDLYAKLSINEHDDPRNAYVNTDKATFQGRYNSIVAVETAILSRR